MNINLHVDCDPLWVYASEHGLTPDYGNTRTYEESLPALFEMLQARRLQATWFVIGRDLALPACRDFCRRVLAAGHALGNHTHSHLKAFHAASPDLRLSEIASCHNAILDALDYRCRGIRFPGYCFDRAMLPLLADLGYLYDSSVLPGPGVLMMSATYRISNRAEREKRFGRPWFLFAPASPWRLNSSVWEVPIGTVPILRLPVHTTFVFRWGMRYLERSLALNRLLRKHLVYLFHAIDLLDGAGPLQRSVAAFSRPLPERREMIARILDLLARETVALTEDYLPSGR